MTETFVIGATGSIGAGTSTTAHFLSHFDFPVFCADKAVHDMYDCGGVAVGPVGAAFPKALIDGRIERDVLSDIILDDPELWSHLDDIVHPLVKKAAEAFLDEQRKKGAPVAVLDVPLLFESGLDHLCDITLCAAAPFAEQRRRVLARPNMTEKKFRAFLSRQMNDDKKRAKADYIVPTGISLSETNDFLRALFIKLGLWNEKNLSDPAVSGVSCPRYGFTKKAP